MSAVLSPRPKSTARAIMNRAVCLVVIDVINSNLNGDPDNGGSPRVTPDDFGEITRVAFLRKVRDLVLQKEGPVWKYLVKRFDLNADDFGIFEVPGRKFEDTQTLLKAGDINKKNFDSRVLGGAFFGDKDDPEKGEVKTTITRGTVQVGMGRTISPVEVRERTITRGMPVEANKSRGMGSLASKTITHGLFVVPIFVNPTMASINGTTNTDIDVFKAVLPHVFKETASASRPQVNILHAQWIDMGSPLGSAPDYVLLDALMPKRTDGSHTPSTSKDDYDIPDRLPQDLVKKYPHLKYSDLVTEYYEWANEND